MANANNLVVGHGRLTRDVTIKKTKNGGHMAYLNVAQADNFKTKGEYQTQFVPYQKYLSSDKMVEYYEKWGKAGNKISITGHISTPVIVDKDGNKEYHVYVVIDNVDLVTGNSANTPKKTADDISANAFE